jgi:GMP synthase (glutamine-hydrolysing)
VPQILVVVHQETSSAGLIGEVLHQAGCRLDVRCPAVGQPLPDSLAAYAGAVVFGGPMSANDDQTLPFIRTELDWIDQVLSANIPYLGICLGAQLLARSLGAQVAANAEGWREIGYYPLQPAADQTLFPTPLQVYHWHKEGFELPAGAQLLATGDRFPNQAFRWGDRAYGLQFHPEITADLIEHWTAQAADQLTLPGAQSKMTQVQQHQLYSQAVENWLRPFLSQWLALRPAIAPDWRLSA